MNTTEKEVTLRYFDFNIHDVVLGAAFHPKESDELKVKALAKLGIIPLYGEEPLHAWLRVMSEENELPFTLPAHPAIVNGIFADHAVSRFMFFLA